MSKVLTNWLSMYLGWFLVLLNIHISQCWLFSPLFCLSPECCLIYLRKHPNSGGSSKSHLLPSRAKQTTSFNRFYAFHSPATTVMSLCIWIRTISKTDKDMFLFFQGNLPWKKKKKRFLISLNIKRLVSSDMCVSFLHQCFSAARQRYLLSRCIEVFAKYSYKTNCQTRKSLLLLLLFFQQALKRSRAKNQCPNFGFALE